MKKPPLRALLSLSLLAVPLLGCSKGNPAVEGSALAAPSGSASASSPAWTSGDPRKFEVTFESGGKRMRGWVVRAPNAPPRPVLVYNHGSSDRVGWDTYGDVATWLASQGYVVFFPFRRGVEGSEGDHLDEEFVRSAEGDQARVVIDHLIAENDDVNAGIAWIRAQPFVDPKRIAVAGCSFGGIETLLSAERGTGIYAAVDFAGASAMWASSPLLRERMTAAANAVRVPVMFVQAKNDFNTAPSEILSATMRAAGKNAELRIYPPRGSGPREGHAFCVTGFTTWGEDVLAFLKANEPR